MFKRLIFSAHGHEKVFPPEPDVHRSRVRCRIPNRSGLGPRRGGVRDHRQHKTPQSDQVAINEN